MVKKRRLFVGIELDEPTRAAIVRAASALERPGLEAKLERAEKLHATLVFLGAVAADDLPALIARLREAVATIEAFSLRFDTVGGFPNRRRASIAWVGAHKPDPAFVQLATAVREAAGELVGPDAKRPFLHVTVGRLREPHRLPPVRFAARTMRVGEIALFESFPSTGTTRYEIVERLPLGATAPPLQL